MQPYVKMEPLNHDTLNNLFTLLRAIPDELIGVIGSHMTPGDQAAARLVSRRWCELMRQAVSHVIITPHQLSHVPVQQQQQQREGTWVLRHHAQQRKQPSGRDPPPEFTLPPSDFALLPATFPVLDNVSIRLLSRHGQRGEGVNSQCARVEQLFDALKVIAHRQGIRLCEHLAAEPAGLLTHSPSSNSKPPKGMHVSLEVDVDVPRTRHQQAHAAAMGLLTKTWGSLARLSDGLSSLALHWYDPSIAKLPALAECLEGLSGRCLSHLKMGLTPGTLLPSLSGLQALTSLQCTVGEDMHMADLQVPRHTEICVLSRLTRLSSLKLGGWVCEVTLAHALEQLPSLESLEFGEDLGSLQGLTLVVLTRLTSLTIPTSLPIHSNACDEVLLDRCSHSKQGGQCQPQAKDSHQTTAPTLTLPRLLDLCAPPPLARMHDGKHSTAPPQHGFQHQTASNTCSLHNLSKSSGVQSTVNRTYDGGMLRPPESLANVPAGAVDLDSLAHMPPGGLELHEGQLGQTQQQLQFVQQPHPPHHQLGQQHQHTGQEQQHTGKQLHTQQQAHRQHKDGDHESCVYAHVIPKGAARRRARWPQLIVPSLRQLSLDLGQQQRAPQAQESWPSAMAYDGNTTNGCAPWSDNGLPTHCFGALGEASIADLGPSLQTLSSLQCKLQADPLALHPVLEALAAQAMPKLQDLELHVTRPSMLHPASLLVTHTDVLNSCIASGCLRGLSSLRLTAVWDGLIPEGYTDYTTRGALGGKPGAIQPSGLLPKTHLGFLARSLLELPSLTHLHLTTDRFRIDLCPPSLTCLVLEGLVKLDPFPALAAPQYTTSAVTPTQEHVQQAPKEAAPPPLITPKLQHLSVVLARHPRELVPANAGAPAANTSSLAPHHQQQTQQQLSPQLPQLPPQQQQQKPQLCPPPQQQVPVQRVSNYCVLDVLAPLLGPALTHLSFTATPGPQVACRMEALTPAAYGIEQLVALHNSGSPFPTNPADRIRATSGATPPLSHRHVSVEQGQDASQAGASKQVRTTGSAGANESLRSSSALGTWDAAGSPPDACQARLSTIKLGDQVHTASTSAGSSTAACRAQAASGQGGRLRSLRSLSLYVMPRVAFLMDCAQLTPLSQLHSLRTLSLDSPITGATRLVRLQQLSCLTSITELVTGKLDNEAYTGHLSLGHMSPTQRLGALTWVSGLVAQRFGTLPSLPTPTQCSPAGPTLPPSTPGASSQALYCTPAAGAASQTLTPSMLAAADVQALHSSTLAACLASSATMAWSAQSAPEGSVQMAQAASNTAAAAGAAAAAFLAGPVEEEANALQGSDDDVNSDDLMYESGEDDEDSGGDVPGAWEDED